MPRFLLECLDSVLYVAKTKPAFGLELDWDTSFLSTTYSPKSILYLLSVGSSIAMTLED